MAKKKRSTKDHTDYFKLLKKIERFSSVKLSVDELVPGENGLVQRIGYDFTWGDKIHYGQALQMVRDGRAQVHSANTIYVVSTSGKKRILNCAVRQRDNNICFYCGKYGDTADHLIPRSKGGKTTLENMVCSCRRCNEVKGDYYKKDENRENIRRHVQKMLGLKIKDLEHMDSQAKFETMLGFALENKKSWE